MKTLSDVFEHTLQDIYYAENAIIKSLPVVIKAAKSEHLKKGLQEHLAETKQQVKILDSVFATINVKPMGEKCDAIEGLIKETQSVIDEAKPGMALDAALIGCCQAIEHYEIARYGTLREWARSLDNDKAHDLLSQILDQEKAANQKLTHLAVAEVNAA